jgi:hypothetical protein
LGMTKITGMMQADVGHAALKVGESMFSGMKFLGGMALEAAKSRVAGGGAGSGGVGGTPEGRVGGHGHTRSSSRSGEARIRSGSPGGRFVSRSAPDNDGGMASHQDARMVTAMDRERRYSSVSSSASSSVPPSPHVHLAMVAPHTRGVAENGHFVTVVDLSSLLVKSSSTSQTRGAVPTKIDEFNASRSQTLADIKFSSDGTSLAVFLLAMAIRSRSSSSILPRLSSFMHARPSTKLA